ncbi:AfsA-related hotdog domain-containing protein [Allonocardiopsis opalescens]|uniref:A-factor biosynthesis hotdog protein n=1 Tax=Allonocardiopsis opalescens TaxID=1144618 RepID=A0A2T0QB05_9ACTN|nr:AfsA-related hotdog domain-containing protein [Allonocardiopsis opalescens]PRY01023.1 A-factor biosynthesis hotdog protein [Allonocardiopsis opalescens]
MTTSTTTLIVVGDRFEEFLANRGTVAASELTARLRAGELEPGTVLVVGQGLSIEERAELAALVAADPSVRLAGGELAEPAGRPLTHKHDPRNGMIAPPVRAGEDRFTAELLIDQYNEILADHLTGQHIPGIALTEAARQTWTAVTEQFYLDADAPRTRFVLGTITSAFHRFVFPLPATVEYRLVRRERTAVDEVFHCVVTVNQGGHVAAEITADYRVIPERFSAKQEALAARSAVAALITATAAAESPVLSG